MSVRAHLSAVLAVALALGTAACSTAAADPASEEAVDITAAPTVGVVDDAFEPVHAEVTPGTTVRWSWDGTDTQHNVVGDDFESPTQDAGTFEHTVDEPGTFAYRCTIHGRMRGAITVAG